MSGAQLVLTGNENMPALPMSAAEVNHLRLMLAWLRCEYMIDDDMQRGLVEGVSNCVRLGFVTPSQAGELVTEKAKKMSRCPKYVRQAVKMLTKALREHEKRSKIVEADHD